MCKHNWIKVNDVCVCTKCNITRTHDGKIIFDKNFGKMLAKSAAQSKKVKK